MKKDKNKKVNLIVQLPPARELTPEDSEGGETQGMISDAARKAKNFVFGSKKEINVETIKDNLENCLNQVNNILKGVKQNAIEGWDLDSISVSLAVSTEGSIGIATVGVEASIEVSFSRTPSAQ